MKLSLLGFVLRRVANSLRQLLWSHVLTIVTLALTLFVFGVFMLLQIHLEHWFKVWGGELQITAYLAKGLGPEDVQRLLQRVQGMAEVDQLRHTSPDQAWRDFQTGLGSQSGLLDGLPRDVLPASIEITLRPPHRDGPMMEQVAARLRQEKAIVSVEYPHEWVERLGLFVLAVQWAKWTVGALLFLAMFFVVGNMVKLALWARRDEVEILQLVGASEEVIQAPFVLEGLLQGLLGGAISVAALWAACRWLSNELAALVGLIAPLGRLQFLAPADIALLLAIGSFLAAAASLVALRRLQSLWTVTGR